MFIHGVLVDSTLWAKTADLLAGHGIRSYRPDLPLGSHRIPLPDDADRGPRGVARLIGSFLEKLDLKDVVLVGNDTGGALCQLLVDADAATPLSAAPASRVGRLVLTNCDAFDAFPPFPFNAMFKTWRSPAVLGAMMKAMGSKAMRHSPLAYGGLMASKIDPAMTAAWVEPAMKDERIRRDLSAFVSKVDPKELDQASSHLDRFEGPSLVIWGTDDMMFKLDFGRRLAKTLKHSTLQEVPGSRTFVAIDQPDVLAGAIAKFAGADLAGANLAGADLPPAST